jgi:NAD(P)-dependent dehydrogenase (short-subunit alcohol dehydrogenase family)
VVPTTDLILSMAPIKGVALVTGASQGIGRAIALRLADDGYDVAINDIPRSKENLEKLSQEIQSKGRKTFSFVGDVSVEDDVKGMIAGTVAYLGSLDVVSPLLVAALHFPDLPYRWSLTREFAS